LDLDGKAMTIPADQLIFGKPKTIGSTMVCLPVLGDRNAAPNEGK